jgi:hypothetical protein
VGAGCTSSEGTPVELASDTSPPIDITVDSTSVYWTDSDGDVMKTPICGGASVVLAQGQGWLKGIAVDSTSVYWAGASGVSKVPLGGGTPELLAAGSQVSALAVDAAYVYWSDLVVDAVAVIRSVPVGGGALATLAAEAGAPSSFIALDTTSVYWVSGGQALVRALKTGGAVTTLIPSIGGGGPIAVDATQVYFPGTGDEMFSVMSEPKAGGAASELAVDQSGLTRFALDGTTVYWVDGLLGTIVSAPTAGGAHVILAESNGAISGLAVDGTSVYWGEHVTDGDAFEAGLGGGDAGRVMKLTPK